MGPIKKNTSNNITNNNSNNNSPANSRFDNSSRESRFNPKKVINDAALAGRISALQSRVEEASKAIKWIVLDFQWLCQNAGNLLREKSSKHGGIRGGELFALSDISNH